MDRTLSWTIDEKDGDISVCLTGELTENSTLRDLLAGLRGGVRFDLAGVSRINSPGVREWISFITEAGKKTDRMALERCSIPFVNQLNMISNFRGPARIASFYAPYYCATCAKDDRRLVDLTTDVRAQIEAPLPCPTCREPMEFDDVIDAYLAFLG